MDKSTIYMAIFNSYVKLPDGISMTMESSIFDGKFTMVSGEDFPKKKQSIEHQ